MMTSRTPIRLTPHRGPLATPVTSPESSPTSTPDIDIPHCSAAIRSTLDVAILQYRISTLSPPTRHQSWSYPSRRRREVTKQELLPLSLIFENLIYSASEFAKTVAGIATFCLFIWGILEWSSYASEPPRQPNPWIPLLQFPLPSPTRALRCHVNPSLCESRDQPAAVLHFLSEQIQHAKVLSSLSVGLGLPLRAFFEAHRATIPRVVVRHNLPEPSHLVQDADPLANLTEFLDPPLLEFTSSSFIGRSFALALEELGDLISEPMVLHGSSTNGKRQDVHLHAIYWRTASNLLLEYSAARPRARKLLQHLHALHHQLSPLVSGHYAVGSIEGKPNIWWWKDHPADGVQAFMTGLEVTLDNVRRLIAYLDWITAQLAQTTLRDVLKIRHRTDFSSCMMSLQELFDEPKASTSKKSCFCLNDYRVTPSSHPEIQRVKIMVPGSPTRRAGR
ncbi:hypothetical protein HD554DRAFT_2096330 [Boletus coccyginus]|nr:hypothetical protein HD554DRAFT_2096330 [Boletus coccyginus]